MFAIDTYILHNIIYVIIITVLNSKEVANGQGSKR